MTYLFPNNGFTLAEHRLVRMAGEAPTPGVDKLKAADGAKEAIKDTNIEARLKSAERLNASGKNEEKNLDAFKEVAEAKFAAEKGKTPPASDEDALKAAQDLLKTDFKFVKVESNGAAGVKVSYETPNKASAFDNLMAGDPDLSEIKDWYDASGPEFKAVIQGTLKALDANPANLPKLKEFVEKSKDLTGKDAKALITALLNGKEPVGSPKALDAYKTLQAAGLLNFMKDLGKILDDVAFNENSAETLKKANLMLVAARKGYKDAKPDDKDYIRETTLGRLQMMGVNVAGEESLLTAEPMPKLEMLQVTEKWEGILNKVMGFARLAGAIMAKFEKIKSKAKGGSSTPSESGDKEVKTPKLVSFESKALYATKPLELTVTAKLEGVPPATARTAIEGVLKADKAKLKAADPANPDVLVVAPVTKVQSDAIKVALDTLVKPAEAAPVPVGPEAAKKKFEAVKTKAINPAQAKTLNAAEMKTALETVRLAITANPTDTDLPTQEKNLMLWDKYVQLKPLNATSLEIRARFSAARTAKDKEGIKLAAAECTKATDAELAILRAVTDDGNAKNFINSSIGDRITLLNTERAEYVDPIGEEVKKKGVEWLEKTYGTKMIKRGEDPPHYNYETTMLTTTDRHYRCVFNETKLSYEWQVAFTNANFPSDAAWKDMDKEDADTRSSFVDIRNKLIAYNQRKF